MANFETIIRNGKGKAGSNQSWEVKGKGVPGDEYVLWHYHTIMLVWLKDTKEILYTSTGYNSVSDQQAMNKAFRVLGSNLYFSRKDGEIR